jgi:arylsulfatase
MRTTQSVFLGFTLLLVMPASASPAEKPNIVFMMADNLGFGDVGVYGGGELRGAPTPRIDQLAREGLRFTQFLVEPGCTPSRAATMTGRYSVRSGLSLVIVPGTPNTLSEKEVTMAEVLQSVGYDTAYYGKWHLGTQQESLPHRQGFDDFYGIPNTTDETLYVPTSVQSHATLPPGFTQPHIIQARAGGRVENVKPYDFETRRTIDVELADRAVDFIRQRAGDPDPFFLFIAWTRPHYPNYTSPAFEGKSRIGVYGDSLMELDHNAGRVLDALDGAGLRDDTIVVFMSDNGPMRTSTWPDSGSAGPFRGELGDPLEGSIRTIGMIRWPKKIAVGESNEMFSTMDFMPTFARIAGAKMPADRPIDGVDQTDFLLGRQKNSNREHLITFTGDQLQAVRWRQFRYYLVDVTPTGSGASRQEGLAGAYRPVHYPLIFDIEADPREEFNANVYRGWVAGHAARLIEEYLQTLARYPNPAAPNLTNFRGNP